MRRAVMVICAAVRGCGAADRGHTCVSDLLFPAVYYTAVNELSSFAEACSALTVRPQSQNILTYAMCL